MADTQQVNTTETALVPSGALAQFAPDPEKVKALAAQFVMTLAYNGAEKLEYKERVALAAASLAYNLSPALGEIWAIHDKGIMVGAAGYIKKLNEYADKHGFQWRGHELRVYKEDFREYGIPDDAQIAYRYVIRRIDWDDFYSQRAIDLAKAGFKYEQILEMMGPSPSLTGIGYVAAGETLRGGMSIGQKAIKRALTNALKKFISLPFASDGDLLDDGSTVDSENTFGKVEVSKPDPDPNPEPEKKHEDVEDGEVVEVKPTTSAVPETAEKAAQDKPESELEKHFGASQLKRPWSPDVLKQQIDIKVRKSGLQGDISDSQRTKLAIALNSFFNDQEEPDKFRHTLLQYLRNTDTSTKLTKAEASVLIDWSESADAITEARAVVRQNAVDMGQEDMFKAPLKDAA